MDYQKWIEVEGWIRIRGRLSNKFNWNFIPAKKENRKGRAKGGIIVAVNKVLQLNKVLQIWSSE